MSDIPHYLQRDAAWEESKRRLWAMSVDERVAAMRAGALSLRQCLHWASQAPQQVPLLHGEYEFLAIHEPDIAEHQERRATASRTTR